MRHPLLASAIVSALGLAALPARADIVLDEFAGFKFSLEGLLQVDRTQYSDDVTPLVNDSEVRRTEIVLKGKAEKWEWVIGYDASTRNDKFLDVNAKFKLAPKLGVTLGQYKQPNSMEELSSTKNNDFIPKAMVTSTFGVGRRVGAALVWTEKSWSATGSVFGREITDGGGTGSGFGGRFAWSPVNLEGNVVHLGLSGISQDTNDDSARLRARPGMDMSTTPRLVDTGTFRDADRINTLGLEAGWVAGPFKLQGEYMDATVKRNSHDDFSGDAWYVSGLWNLTGETWGYRNGVFTTSKPATGSLVGMWQLGLRYEGINLNDGAVRGGEEKNLALGVNWYMRNNLKFMLNYVRADVTRPNGSSDKPSALEARAQLHW